MIIHDGSGCNGDDLQYGRPRPSCAGLGSHRWLQKTLAHVFNKALIKIFEKET